MNWSRLIDRLPPRFKRRPALLGIVAALLIVAFVAIRATRSKAPPTSFFETRRGDFTVSVVEGGTLAAVSEVSIRNEVEGTARVIYIVPEGSYVKKGDLLVELDSSQAQDQVNQQQINFEKAQFALVQAEATLKIQESAVASDIRAAQLKLRFAQLDRDKYVRGQQLVDLIEASNKLVQAQAQLAVNLDNYVNTTNLAAKGYETKQKMDADGLSLTNTRNSLVISSNQLWMLQEFDQKKLLERFDSDVNEAEHELERVKAQSERKIAQYVADVLTSSNTLVLNQRKLDRDRRNLAATQIYAPEDGLVVYPVSDSHFSSESLIEEGATVRNRQELIKLPDTSRMKVTIKVHESHVNMVRVGQPAFIKLDSMPDQRFRGTVEKVALLPDTASRWGNPNLKIYNTDVVITDPLPGVKPGVSAQAEVIVTNIANVLSVPIQSVTTLKGRQVVYAQLGGKVTPIPVQVGMFNTKYIEILSGLSEGIRVLLSPPFDTQEKDLEGTLLAADERASLIRSNAVASTAPVSGRTPVGAADAEGIRHRAGPAIKSAGGDAREASPLDASARTDSRGGGQEDQRSRSIPDELLKLYDKNNDGRLDGEERAAMPGARGPGVRGPAPGNETGAQRRPGGERPRQNAAATNSPPPGD